MLSSANSASSAAYTAWLGFILLLAYLLMTLAGVTHKDLLLNSPVTLPIVDVKIPLFTFFIVAPILLIVVHLGLLVQHALLAHKLQRFSRAVSGEESGGLRIHPLRVRLHDYTFSQLLVGPRPPARLGWLMRRMMFPTLVAMPILTLLYFQIKFLPYHDEAVTNVHRALVVLGLFLIFAMRRHIGLYPYWPDSTGEQMRSRTGYWLGIGASVVIVLFSFFVATVPDACLYKSHSGKWDMLCTDRMMRNFSPVTAELTRFGHTRVAFLPTAWLFEGDADHVRGLANTPFGWSRNLIVTDEDLVPDKEDQHGEVSLSLRGRDLRYAVLDRSDLHRADLTGVDLTGASLAATRLEDTIFNCADPGGRRSGSMKCAHLRRAHLRGASLTGAKLHGADLQGADLTEADLRKAQLPGADLQGADLTKADLQLATLSSAGLQGANLQEAELQGADLTGARLGGAEMRWAKLQGADLRVAELQGADLFGAELQGADLRGAKLEGTDLLGAQLQGAVLELAVLEGAELRGAELQGADLRGAKLNGADLRRASVWQTGPPGQGALDQADFKEVVMREPSADEVAWLAEKLQGLTDKEVRARVAERLEPLPDEAERKAWKDSADYEAWTRIAGRSRPDPAKLCGFLAKLACHEDFEGYPVTGIAIRTLRASEDEDARLDAPSLAKALLEDSCKGEAFLGKGTKNQLRQLAEKAPGAACFAPSAAPDPK